MRIGIIDLLGKEPPRNAYSHLMRANNTSIMAQVVGVWCEEAGHEAHIAYYSGTALLSGGLPPDLDLLFINAFSQCALVAYAFSALYRSRGVPTVLGGPHARSYPEDARQYFDYVVGFCDRQVIDEILHDVGPQGPVGRYLTAQRQPECLPGLRQRWKFLQPSMEQARIVRLVPVIGSLGCPYHCSFCIDAAVPYQPLDFDTVRDDLRFFRSLRLPRSILAWHDPNFGIRFDQYLDAIEDAAPPGSITFFAEMSLTLLKEDHLKRLRRNGFKAIAPGIESWYETGEKSLTRGIQGSEKVRRVAEHANMVNRYIPYTQCNLLFGLDTDSGTEPFELTRQFVDLAPGIYPHLALLCAFGRNAALNLQYQKDGRVIPVPFHFLDIIQAMNVRPKHYSWIEFYDLVCGVFEHAFSPRALARRMAVNWRSVAGVEQLLRGVSSERNNRLQHLRWMRRQFEDPSFRAFFEGDTTRVPEVLVERVRAHLGSLWEWLPAGALTYDPNGYLASGASTPIPLLKN